MFFKALSVVGLCVSVSALAAEPVQVSVYEFATTNTATEKNDDSMKCRVEIAQGSAVGTVSCSSELDSKYSFTIKDVLVREHNDTLSFGVPNMGKYDEEAWWIDSYYRAFIPVQHMVSEMAKLKKIEIDRVWDIASVKLNFSNPDKAFMTVLHKEAESSEIAIKEIRIRGKITKTRTTLK